MSAEDDAEFELILTHTGGAELVQYGEGEPQTVWASDADDDFKQEFPDLLDENDAAGVFDYLVESGYLEEDEADEALLSVETLDTTGAPLEGEFIPANEDD